MHGKVHKCIFQTNLGKPVRGVMSLTAEALKKLGSEAAEGAAKEAKDWETVSASAYESLDCVDKRALSEVKMLPNPPAEVKELFSAVAICLGEAKCDWATCKKMIGDRAFLQRVKDFNPSTINAKMLKQLKPLVSKTDFTHEIILKKSKAAASCLMWVLAVYEYGSDQAL